MSLPGEGDFTLALHDELTRHFSNSLARHGVTLDTEQISQLALDVSIDLQLAWRGQQIYIPTCTRSKTIRHRIFEEFTGDNIQALVQRYQLSTKTIYTIIAQERSRGTEGDPSQLRFPGT